jgi:ATP-dependent Clp protease protease subunit
LLVLATEDRQKPIIIYIESPGGSVSESLGVISTINGIHSPVVTFSRGSIAGLAAVIAAHGKKGFRTADPGAHFSLRLLEESSRDGSSETHESYLKLLAQILAEDTGQPQTLALTWLSEGAEFNAQEAVQKGLVDVIGRQPHLPKVN